MVGTNTDDWRLFLVARRRDRPDHRAVLTGPGGTGTGLAAYGLPVETALAAYRAAHPGASPGDLLAAIQTDWWWRIPAIRLADAHAKSPAATYMYEFAWRSPQFDGRLGACHALEIAFVFDTLGKGADQMLGRCWEPTRRNSSPTPCTPPGWRLPPTETPVGRSTTSAAGQPCASIRPRRSWTILDPRSGQLWEGVR